MVLLFPFLFSFYSFTLAVEPLVLSDLEPPLVPLLPALFSLERLLWLEADRPVAPSLAELPLLPPAS
jgi:hypothetical protein